MKIKAAILKKLSSGSINKKKLVEALCKTEGVSVQGVYKTIRELKEQDILIEKQKDISVSKVWVEKQLGLLEKIRGKQKKDSDNFSGEMIKNGGSVRYDFNTWKQLDQVWGHFLLSFAETLNQKDSIYIYYPHYWFPIVRNSAETEVFGWLEKNKKETRVCLGNSNFLDTSVTRRFLDKFSIHRFSVVQKITKIEGRYITVIGKYIIEVNLDKNISKQLDVFFENNRVVKDREKSQLEKLVNTKGKNNIKIYKDTKVADLYRKKLKKYFT